MIDHSHLFNRGAFSISQPEKNELLQKVLNQLTRFHYLNCKPYQSILDSIGFTIDDQNIPNSQLPFLPVSLFKSVDLMSINTKDIFKTMHSSGTTGQTVSKIYLDKETSILQQKALIKIVSEFTGLGRSPMLIIDSPKILKERNTYSARVAALLGFSLFASKKCFALNDDMELNIPAIKEFINSHPNQKIFIFGFTSIIWNNFYLALKDLKVSLDLSNAVLIHGGGWKKLTNKAVSNSTFKKELENICGLNQVHNYYGMIEQTGSIFLECSQGNLHTSIFNDIIIRRGEDFSSCNKEESGLVQVLSALPLSYCGHSLITEDEGVIMGEDDCKCGYSGKYFRILGRTQQTEIRGCSDSYEE